MLFMLIFFQIQNFGDFSRILFINCIGGNLNDFLLEFKSRLRENEHNLLLFLALGQFKKKRGSRVV